MLTDTPLSFDHRVLSAFVSNGQPRILVIPRKTPKAWRYLSLALAVTVLPALVLAYGSALRRLAGRMGAAYGTPLSGMRAFVKLQAAPLHFFWTQRSLLAAQPLIYAHDQACGTVAWLTHLFYRVPYVYDAHEIVPFRARRTGLFRMLLEFGWEKALVRGSRSCCVVNRPMRQLYRRLYGAADFTVRPNDFFVDRQPGISSAGPALLVYVGAVGAHRGLERMRSLAEKHAARLLLFCSNTRAGSPDFPAEQVFELANYEQVLLERVEGTAPYFWCCFDTDILSYRYSLPNKFFQALALGIPIVAAHGSYLGRLVARHGIGITLGDPAQTEPDPWARDVHRACLDAMARFKSAYRRGDIAI